MAVHKQGDSFIIVRIDRFVKLLQRNIYAAGNMTLPVLLGCTHIQKDRALGIAAIRNTPVDIRCFYELKESHSLHLLKRRSFVFGLFPFFNQIANL